MVNGETTLASVILTFYDEMSKMKTRKSIREEVILWQRQNKLKI